MYGWSILVLGTVTLATGVFALVFIGIAIYWALAKYRMKRAKQKRLFVNRVKENRIILHRLNAMDHRKAIR